jgi:FkbH-like protein
VVVFVALRETIMQEPKYRLSRFARVFRGGGICVIGNGIHMTRAVLDATFSGFCELVERAPVTMGEVEQACPRSVNPATFLKFLQERHLVVPEHQHEEQQVSMMLDRGEFGNPTTRVDQAGSRWPPPTHYWEPCALTADDFASSGTASAPLQDCRIFLVGGCVVQAAEETIVKHGRQRGFDVQLRHAWPPLSEHAIEEIRRWEPHLLVLQLTVHPLLTPIWDDGVNVDASRRRTRLESLKVLIRKWIGHFAEAAKGSVGLVHNFAPPSVSPFGRMDFRNAVNFREITAELNLFLDQIVSAHSHLMVLDEERLAVRHGGANLFDELFLPFGHHGAASALEPLSVPLSPVLAREYFDLYEIYRGIGRIRCIVVDLDGTLWPGIAADDGFDWVDGDDNDRWIRLGLHQALRVMKSRGILLAVCSKGSHEATIAAWRQAKHGLMLVPEDFVELMIDWRPKSESLALLCKRLGFTPDQFLFLDDNPVERDEVRRNYPTMQIPEIEVSQFRNHLLSAPGCEVTALTDEARARTETTRAMLMRAGEMEHASGMPAFLESLKIEINIRRPKVSDRARISELINRTNQFTTTGMRVAEEDIDRLLSTEDTDVFLMSVRDRFAEYGTVGVCVIRSCEISAVAISCRVIGLDVAVPFLINSLAQSGRDLSKVTGILVETARNQPARDVFARAGFSEIAPGEWRLHSNEALKRDGFPQRVTIQSN